MSAQSLLFFLVLALLLVALLLRRRENQESVQVLRHTIGVNLEILEGELDELLPIAIGTPPSAAQEEGHRLLQQAQSVATSARSVMHVASSYELELILGQVFGAMMQSTEARRLLNARRPRS